MRDKKELLRQIMIELSKNSEAEANKLIKVFMQYIPEITAEEVTDVAQQLENEGYFADPSQHVNIERHVFTLINEKIPKQDLSKFVEGHPIHTFIKENELIKAFAQRAKDLEKAENSFTELKSDWVLMVKNFNSVDLHYLRKENQLFPFLEKRGFNHPSTIMWSLHNEIRRLNKVFATAVKEDDEKTARETILVIAKELLEMIVKEEVVLLPTSARLLSENNWLEIHAGEEEIGWMVKKPIMWNPKWVHPGVDESQTMNTGNEKVNPVPFVKGNNSLGTLIGAINLDVGVITAEQINLIFKYLPFDVTYVDEFDKVRYYNKGDDRVFPRSPGIIGREVRYCHPPKSVHMVEEIVDAFKKGEKDEASFWINMDDKFIHIQFFALRNSEGHYKGVMEITFDASTIRSLEGEQRLLDWKND